MALRCLTRSPSECRPGYTSKPDWDAAWKKIEHLPDPYDGKPHRVEFDGREYVYEYRDVRVADLVDEAAVKTKLMDPIEDWLRRTA